MTMPFVYFIPRDSVDIDANAIVLSFWGIHAIMVHSVFSCITFRSIFLRQWEAAKSRKDYDGLTRPESATALVVLHLLLALIFGLLVSLVLITIFHLWNNGDYKACTLVLSFFAGQSVSYWIELKHRAKD